MATKTPAVRKGFASTKPLPKQSKKGGKGSRIGSASAVYPLYSSTSLLPMTKLVTLPYAMEFLASSAGFSYNTFYSHNCHDPDYTGGGHQPRGWDQLKVFFKFYRVLSCKVHARFSWEETPSQSACVGIYVDDDSSFDYSTTTDLYERNGYRLTKNLNPDRDAVVTAQETVDIDKWTRGALKTSRTAVGSSPTEAAPFIHVFSIFNNTAAATYGGVRIHVQLEYRVLASEPNPVGGS